MAKGRPTKYKDEYARMARKACLMGATNDDLAELFDVATSTIHEWRDNHEDFSDAIKQAKVESDAQVERALFERATGYSHPEVKVFHDQGEIYTWEGIKHYPPDTAAAFIWLKNRQPQRWRDKQEIEHSGAINITIEESEKDL